MNKLKVMQILKALTLKYACKNEIRTRQSKVHLLKIAIKIKCEKHAKERTIQLKELSSKKS